MGMDNYRGNNKFSLTHKKYFNFLFLSKILLSLKDLNKDYRIDFKMSHNLILPLL